MVLSRIQTYLQSYKKWLHEVRHHPFLYKWETVRQFQLHWDVSATDPAAMYDRALQNSETRRLWQDDAWQPKHMMLLFWKSDPDLLRAMFDDLFNEQKEVENRLSRFVFGCDTLLSDYKKSHPLSVENNHYHGDYRMPAWYLCGFYPDQYAPYDLAQFQAVLQKLQARDIPQQHDPARWFKVARTLMGFLEKDPEIPQSLQRQLMPAKHYTGRTLLLAEDFCRFIASA